MTCYIVDRENIVEAGRVTGDMLQSGLGEHCRGWTGNS